MIKAYDEDQNPFDDQVNILSKTSNTNDLEVIKILLEEYKTLRQESLGSIRLRIQILSFGLAAIILLFGVPLSSRSGINVILLNIIYTFIIPLLCTIIVNIWLGELYRMERAGNFLYLQELRINKAINRFILSNDSYYSNILSWEGWLRGKVTAIEMWPLREIFGLENSYLNEKIKSIEETILINKKELKITTAYEKSIELFYYIAYGSCTISLFFPIIIYFSQIEKDKYFNYIGGKDTAPMCTILILITFFVVILLRNSQIEAKNQYKIIRKK